MKAAFVTLVTRESYLAGTLVLNHSLRSTHSKYELVAMATPGLSAEGRAVLTKSGMKLRDISRLDPSEGTHALAAHDERFSETWTKLRVFELIEYDRVVFLDSDMIVCRNMDELLDYELPGKDWIAATHACACNPHKLPHYPADWIPANCAYTPLKSDPGGFPPAVEITHDSPRPYGLLNSGAVLLQPSKVLSQEIYAYLATSPLVSTFSFPDQDLLAAFFKGRWRPLPYVFNALKTLRVIHKPLWRDEEVRCLHYILPEKPWMQPRGTAGAEYDIVNGWWWDIYDELKAKCKEIHPESWKLVEAQVAKV